MPIDEIKQKLDTLFEKHRVSAYETILKVSLNRKNLAETNMLKAYVTFVTTAELEGYEQGGMSWLAEFSQAMAAHLAEQDKNLNSSN